jgi:hypothetical protein
MLKAGWEKSDPHMYFSYYAADRTTDPDFEDKTPEERANPSMSSWTNKRYLDQQRRRLPSHKYRRLHLNLPGSPEGSAFSAERIFDAIERGCHVRLPQQGVGYAGFVDMSGGSIDDAVLCIAHRENKRAVIDAVINQGQRPPFDPRQAAARFAKVLKDYRLFSVTGDQFAGNTFAADFQTNGIAYRTSDLTKSELYEALEPKLNACEVTLLDVPELESQFLGLVWRNNKIDHLPNEHDDWSNAAAGAVHQVLEVGTVDTRGISLLGERRFSSRGDWLGLNDRNEGSAVNRAWDDGSLFGRGKGKYDW